MSTAGTIREAEYLPPSLGSQTKRGRTARLVRSARERNRAAAPAAAPAERETALWRRHPATFGSTHYDRLEWRPASCPPANRGLRAPVRRGFHPLLPGPP